TCSSYWLTRVLGDDVVPYAESRRQTSFSREQLLSRPVWTLGTHQIEQIASKAVDAFINIFSFQEMPLKIIENYFSQADRLVKGVVYIKQRTIENNTVDKERITEASYPVRSSWSTHFRRPILLYAKHFEAAFGVGNVAAGR